MTNNNLIKKIKSLSLTNQNIKKSLCECECKIINEFNNLSSIFKESNELTDEDLIKFDDNFK